MAQGEDVYCTLVLNDAYLPGASVLSHSLRDCGTTHKLACLVTADTLSASSLDELRSLYNYVIAVPRVATPNPGGLHLMNRPDLLYTFTKIQLWRQTQFRKIVYVDADVVALRAPEELFDTPDAFAAAPDVGWPDAFNTGVMVLNPSDGEYRALQNLASAGDSFDGADQGLLNQYFENKPWKRLSFTYNCTPSANYQYEPAYRYYKSNISLLHFIGRSKPWMQNRSSTAAGAGVYQELSSRWWAVYDRHHLVAPQQYAQGQSSGSDKQLVHQAESLSSTGYPVDTDPSSIPEPEVPITETPGPATGLQHYSHDEQKREFEAPRAEWDATRAPPPIESRPEAANFPSQIYRFNADPEPFHPPAQYPAPPKNMWFEVPETRPQKPEKLSAIFPWEERDVPRPTRRFADDETQQNPAPVDTAPVLSPSSLDVSEFEVEVNDNVAPSTPIIKVTDSSAWAAAGPVNKNAWDEVSGIENYVRALTSRQKNRGQVQVLQGDPSIPVASPSQHALKGADFGGLTRTIQERRESLILTDFPSAVERPSLPVTPAPRRRTTFWGDERDEEGNLPSAEGVPDQADWNPAEQLEQLRRSSLLGPEQLKLPASKNIPDRANVPSAVAIPDPSPGQAVALATSLEEVS